MLFNGFHLISLQIHYLLLLAQVLLVIFETICLRVDILNPLPSCCLLKLRISATISIILSVFSFLGVFFLLTAGLKSVNSSLSFAILSFLVLFALYKSFNKYVEF